MIYRRILGKDFAARRSSIKPGVGLLRWSFIGFMPNIVVTL